MATGETPVSFATTHDGQSSSRVTLRPPALESVVCDNCGCGEAALLFEATDLRCGIDGLFRVVRCANCGLIFLSPRPTADALPMYYPPGYEPHAASPDDHSTRIARWLRLYGVRRRCRAISSRKAHGTLLDVGAATGVFLAEMRHYGSWELHGVEVARRAATHAREWYGLDVFPGELEDAAYPECYFDVVTLWHTLEHLPHPGATLAEIHRILKPDGLLVLEVPDGDSLQARVFGRFWAGLDVPRHLYVFCANTLKTLLAAARFEIAAVEHLSGGYHSFAMSVGFLLQGTVRSETLRGALTTCVSSRVAHAATYPYFQLMRRLGNSPSLTVFAIKRR
jgi:SAM-dependent methyltransferase